MARALSTSGCPRTLPAGTVMVKAPDWFVATEMLSSERNTLAPASGWPWSEITRPVMTAACPWARAGATKTSAKRAPTKNLVERNSFVMRTSEGFRRIAKETDVLAPRVGVPHQPSGRVEIPPSAGKRVRVAWKIGFRFSSPTELQIAKGEGRLGRTGFPG